MKYYEEIKQKVIFLFLLLNCYIINTDRRGGLLWKIYL